MHYNSVGKNEGQEATNWGVYKQVYWLPSLSPRAPPTAQLPLSLTSRYARPLLPSIAVSSPSPNLHSTTPCLLHLSHNMGKHSSSFLTSQTCERKEELVLACHE